MAHAIGDAQTSLVFTNTRSQCEVWYQALLEARPEWAGLIALHHGSLDQAVREWVERGLKNGLLKVVVCTSSLDLGVDFLPVERVFQIGSPKGVARLMQRAGRSGHAPGRPSRVTIVPTHALELVEAAAGREAVEQRRIEGRETPEKPFDVLVQHLVTVAIGGGFDARELYREIRGTYAYRQLTQAEFDWALGFVEGGGAALRAYPDYHRVVRESDGLYRVQREDLVRRHRSNIGTIVANGTLHVAYLSGGRIGAIEESFISRLKPGDIFTFGGRALELIRVQDMTAWVRRATSSRGAMPQWAGSRMPLSSELADATLTMLARAAAGIYDEPEMRAVRPLLELQQKWSALPEPGVLLVELIRSREGHHFFCYPFAGRTAHIGLGCIARMACLARKARHLFDFNERLRVRTALSATLRLGRAIARRATLARRTGTRHSREPQLIRTFDAALSRDRARVGARVPGASRTAEKRAAIAGFERAVLRDLPQSR